MDKYIQSLGGIATGKVLREKAIKDYYSNPNYCKYCEKIIEIKDKQKVSIVKRKKFCDQSCAASYNNLNSSSPRNKPITEGKCQNCGDKVKYKKNLNNKSYTRTKYCKICINASKLDNITKIDLFNKRKNWQSARSCIAKHARIVYQNTNQPKQCLICNYNKTFEVCHKKPVSEFNDDSTVKMINHVDNLIALCPNHHWEYDNGLITIDAE